ncbi:YfcC family protein [Burkholderia sp. 3C]
MTLMHSSPDNAGPARPDKPATSPYVLLFCVLMVAALATWVLPAGEFDRVVRDGVKFVVPHSLHAVPQHGIGPAGMLMAISKSVTDTAAVIFLIMFTGGTFSVLEKTGAVQTAVARLGARSGGNNLVGVAAICIVFSVLGTMGAVSNAVVAFVPLGMLIARSMRLPAEFGVGLIYLGTYAGFNAAVMNPTTTGVSQRLAELPIFSGLAFRAAVFVLFVAAAVLFLIRVAVRQRDSGEAPRPGIASPADESATPDAPTRRQWLVLALTGGGLAVFIYGAARLGWSESEMMATFVAIAIGAGFACRLAPSALANAFIAGCGQLASGALIVGLARAISTVLANGHILDPLVNALADLLAPLHPMAAVIGMFFSSAAIHVAISSGSGESAALIPIFAPLGDALHLTRQVTVQTVLLGEGIMNCINPTSGVLIAVLVTARIPFGRWVKFVAPLTLAWLVISIASLLVAVAIHLGPF